LISVSTRERRALYRTTDHIEAPNWSRDGRDFIFNSGGRLCRLPMGGGQPRIINTGMAIRCNNDHGLSPDGTLLAISDESQGDKSLIYVLPATGGTPRLITPNGPSYWHGWSPDGKTLAFTGQREDPALHAQGSGGQTQHLDTTNFDIYAIPVTGGDEIRLTVAPGLDDGPEFSPDGAYIYFNSERTGHMQIWRMHPDGSDQEQVLNEDSNDWFPHISPDGQWLVFLAYAPGVTGHPADKDVEIRLMSLKSASGQANSDPANSIKVLATLFGGQGTINVPSWSPDSKRIAFVSYEYLLGK